MIAVDPKTYVLPDQSANNAKILKDAAAATDDNGKTFKSFAWSHPISHLGMLRSKEKKKQYIFSSCN